MFGDDTPQQLFSRFRELSFKDRLSIGLKLGLIREDDVRLTGVEINKQIYDRVLEQGIKQTFESEIVSRENKGVKQSPTLIRYKYR